jgi:hypothetical protein
MLLIKGMLVVGPIVRLGAGGRSGNARTRNACKDATRQTITMYNRPVCKRARPISNHSGICTRVKAQTLTTAKETDAVGKYRRTLKCLTKAVHIVGGDASLTPIWKPHQCRQSPGQRCTYGTSTRQRLSQKLYRIRIGGAKQCKASTRASGQHIS